MDLFQAIEFFQQLHPGKEIQINFPVDCFRQIELIHTNGKPNVMHHIECHHVEVIVDGTQKHKVPIKPHRMTVPISEIRKMIDFSDFHLNDHEIVQFKKMREEQPSVYEDALRQLSGHTNMSVEDIKKKIDA